jgi:hypothetical protein
MFPVFFARGGIRMHSLLDFLKDARKLRDLAARAETGRDKVRRPKGPHPSTRRRSAEASRAIGRRGGQNETADDLLEGRAWVRFAGHLEPSPDALAYFFGGQFDDALNCIEKVPALAAEMLAIVAAMVTAHRPPTEV